MASNKKMYNSREAVERILADSDSEEELEMTPDTDSDSDSDHGHDAEPGPRFIKLKRYELVLIAHLHMRIVKIQRVVQSAR